MSKIEQAEATRAAIAASNRETIVDLIHSLKDERALAATAAWGGDAARARTGIRAMLLDCSNLSTQLESYAVDLLEQRTRAVTSLQVVDAAVSLREYTAKVRWYPDRTNGSC